MLHVDVRIAKQLDNAAVRLSAEQLDAVLDLQCPDLRFDLLTHRPVAGDGQGNRFGKIAVLQSINDEFADLQPMEDGRIVGVVVETLQTN